MMDDPAIRDAAKKLEESLRETFRKIPGLDDTPISYFDHYYVEEDPGTFWVVCTMPDGSWRIFAFHDGRPVSIQDHP
ncbi:MAG TPA: hypothetical protein VJT81_00375 [Burkholderiales bacterium]|nr:hypothetical protein [Burkholderiales bacterium]